MVDRESTPKRRSAVEDRTKRSSYSIEHRGGFGLSCFTRKELVFQNPP